MESVNLRDPNSVHCRIYVGHLNESITQELLEIKFNPYGKIVGFLRTHPGFAFVQYEQPMSAANAIQAENNSSMGTQKILVKAAEMKSQMKHKAPTNENTENFVDEPMNKKYFNEANEYYGNNSIMGSSQDSDVNHCEIIVVSKPLKNFAEFIERKLNMLGIRVDLLFPNDQVPINKILGNIQSRGCLYAILLLPLNLEQQSLTLTILYGDATEHRNMPVEDAIKFLYKDFVNKTKKLQHNVYQHPDAIHTMLRTLAENRSLTVLQYDHIIKYLSQRREVQRKAEIGEDVEPEEYIEPTPTSAKSAPTPAVKKASTISPQEELEKRIYDILCGKTNYYHRANLTAGLKPLSDNEKKNLERDLLNIASINRALEELRKEKKICA